MNDHFAKTSFAIGQGFVTKSTGPIIRENASRFTRHRGTDYFDPIFQIRDSIEIEGIELLWMER